MVGTRVHICAWLLGLGLSLALQVDGAEQVARSSFQGLQALQCAGCTTETALLPGFDAYAVCSMFASVLGKVSAVVAQEER